MMPLKLNVGSGPYKMEGYTNVDLLPGPFVDVVSPADQLPFKDGEVDEILAEHLIEHLTYFQFNKTMAEWFRVLKPGGTLTIECPDLLGLCKQFVEANEYDRYTTYKGYWPIIAHIYGHQRGKSEAEEMSQVHKSGYTRDHLLSILYGLGYSTCHDETPKKATPHSPVLRIKAIKCQK